MVSSYTAASTATNSTWYAYGSSSTTSGISYQHPGYYNGFPRDKIYAGLHGRKHWIPNTAEWLNQREQINDVHLKRSLDRAHSNMLKHQFRRWNNQTHTPTAATGK